MRTTWLCTGPSGVIRRAGRSRAASGSGRSSAEPGDDAVILEQGERRAFDRVPGRGSERAEERVLAFHHILCSCHPPAQGECPARLPHPRARPASTAFPRAALGASKRARPRVPRPPERWRAGAGGRSSSRRARSLRTRWRPETRSSPAHRVQPCRTASAPARPVCRRGSRRRHPPQRPAARRPRALFARSTPTERDR